MSLKNIIYLSKMNREILLAILIIWIINIITKKKQSTNLFLLCKYIRQTDVFSRVRDWKKYKYLCVHMVIKTKDYIWNYGKLLSHFDILKQL